MAAKDVQLDVLAVDPEIFVNPETKNITIRAEIVAKTGLKRKRTGRYIHLSVIHSDGIQLANLLKLAQHKFGWPEPALEPPEVDEVPAAHKRQ